MRVHAASEFYDLPGFRAGASTLRPFEIPEVGEVSGRQLLHLQCHMGQDTLSWACLGAHVTGLDFFVEAIHTARALARDIGVADRARFVVSDVYDASAALDGERYDIVYTGFGSLVWLPDLTRWARTVASLLKDQGALYLAEFHPLTETTSVRWQHPLSAVVTALAQAGLRIEFLHEHNSLLFQRYPSMERWGRFDYRFPAGHPHLPLMYSIRAAKTAKAAKGG